MGEGVDLRFCVVRPDYVGHAFEEGQHLDRICLLQGLENPAAKPAVDIFVPDGRIMDKPAAPAGHSFEVEITLGGEAIDFGGGDADYTSGNNLSGARLDYAKLAYARRGANALADGDTDDEGFTVRGAGRGEPLPGGGGAFHFAGLGRGTVPDLDGGTRDGAKLREGSFDATGTASSDFTREAGLGLGGRMDPLQLLVSTLRPRRTLGGVYGMQTREIPEVVVIAPRAQDPPPAVWSSVACDRDPFALRPGEDTGVRMELYGTVTLAGEVKAGSATITGELACYEGGAGTASMKGRLRHTWMHVEVVGSDDTIDPIPLKWAVELTAAVLPGGARSVVAKVEVLPGLELTVTTTFGATPILAKSRLTADLLAYLREFLEQRTQLTGAQIDAYLRNLEEANPGLDEVQLGVASARENADVLRPANADHGAAVQALRRIEAAVREPGFRVDGERKLFPPAPPPPAVPSVAATRDWVLFRRRRASSCDCRPRRRRGDRAPLPALHRRRGRRHHAGRGARQAGRSESRGADRGRRGAALRGRLHRAVHEDRRDPAGVEGSQPGDRDLLRPGVRRGRGGGRRRRGAGDAARPRGERGGHRHAHAAEGGVRRAQPGARRAFRRGGGRGDAHPDPPGAGAEDRAGGIRARERLRDHG